MGKYKCRFCSREMIATALSYQSNQYCNHCFNERADSTQKENLNTFEFMGEKIELENLTPKQKTTELIDNIISLTAIIADCLANSLFILPPQ